MSAAWRESILQPLSRRCNGNRHYDDALLQMKELLEKQGFVVIAAGAFLAEHSIFPAVAEGRPDEKDLEVMREFAGKCARLLQEEELWRGKEIALPGNPDYDASVLRAFPSIRKEMRIVPAAANVCKSVREGDCQRESTKDGRSSVHFLRRLHQGMPGKGKRYRGEAYLTARKVLRKNAPPTENQNFLYKIVPGRLLLPLCGNSPCGGLTTPG